MLFYFTKYRYVLRTSITGHLPLIGGVVDKIYCINKYCNRVTLWAGFNDTLLAWIAKNAPNHLKATFFAVFASFTNLALSASALGTKYLNEIL